MTEKEPTRDVWDDAPSGELVPFLEPEPRAQYVKDGTTLMLTYVGYAKTGQYGPKWRCLLITPDGEARMITMSAGDGGTPRDQINKWLHGLLKSGEHKAIPVKLVKRGNAFMFDRPDRDMDGDPFGNQEQPG